jgi:hypothetical protein
MRFLEKLILVGFVFTGGKALAEDLPKQEFPSEIVYVPPGSVLSQGLKRSTISGKSWLFPESYYQTALQKGQKLEICEPALVKLRDDYSSLLSQSGEQSSSCISKLSESHNREQELILQVGNLNSQNVDLKQKLASARKSSLIAWTVAGSLILGTGTAVYLTLQ